MTGSDDIHRLVRPRSAADEAQARRREAHAWLIRLKPGVATTDDLADFRKWAGQTKAHAAAFADARRLWDGVGPAAHSAAAEADRTGIKAPVTQDRALLRRRQFLGGALAAAAAASYAAVAPPMGLWPSLPDLLGADYRTSKGEQRQLALAGGASFEMNTQTSIAIANPYMVTLLSGEGAVTIGAQELQVVAGTGSMRGSHASFCVRNDGDRIRVTCLEGAIDVTVGDQVATIKRREQVVYSSGALERAVTVDPELVAAWRTGYLKFQDTPLGDVVAEANRYRRGKIIIASSALGQRLVNARFRLDQIEDIVPKLAEAFGASATSLPGGVVILS